MRIIAGVYKGRRLGSLGGAAARPTTDRVREALASSVASARRGGFEGARVFDAFAGSGALGIEALSRGASFCLFVDKSAKAATLVKSNLETLQTPKTLYEVRVGDAFTLTARSNTAGAPFDIVFLDPPYATPAKKVCGLVESLATQGLLGAGALVVYEHGANVDDKSLAHIEGVADGFKLSTKRYGDTSLSYLTYA
jgi:16S rRNA (guanine966-N2)-methyltransferase